MVTHKLRLDMQRPSRQILYMKQYDTARSVELSLYSDGQEWPVPTDSTIYVAYQKQDGTGGAYSKIDSIDAGSIGSTSSTAQVILAPQVLTCAGLVAVEVRFVDGNTKLATFTFYIDVAQSAAGGATSEDYYNPATAAELTKDIKWLTDVMGDIAGLETTAKDSIVAAINEIVSKPALPIARGDSNDGIAYTATGDALPTVQSGRMATRIGKGLQIVFIPYAKNADTAPTLQLNGGEIIQLRLRAPQTQNNDDQSPDATMPVPVGSLMRGVPYTLTFCGYYWLVDSQIAQFPCATDEFEAALMRAFAKEAIVLEQADTVAVPIINSQDGVVGSVARAVIRRTKAEEDDAQGDVEIPSTVRVKELIDDAIGAIADYDEEAV